MGSRHEGQIRLVWSNVTAIRKFGAGLTDSGLPKRDSWGYCKGRSL